MENLYNIKDKVIVVTGAGGILGGSISKSLSQFGAKIVVLDIKKENIDSQVHEIKAIGGSAAGFCCNVLDTNNLEEVSKKIVDKWGRVDVLINCTEGNVPDVASTTDQTIFDMQLEEWEKAVKLNQDCTILPCLTFGKIMAQQKKGSIVNILSMATYSALTLVPGYLVAKKGVDIFTKWLSAEMATKFGDEIRVNAIAPGFFITDQNRTILLNPDGSLTEKSKMALAKTPMGRFGNIAELNGLVHFLCSDSASFITGAIIPVDGGFSAFSGV